MAIPSTITAKHIVEAIRRIDRDGVPKGRHARGYELVYEGRRYPPKYVVALAGEIATGTFLDSERFGGGTETNGFLKKLGFTVVAKGANAPDKVRVGRVFLDIGVRQGAFKSMGDKPEAFGKFSRQQFTHGPAAYVKRIVDLVERAHAEGASVVALPACAFQLSSKVTLADYIVTEVPWLVAGGVGADNAEFAVVLHQGKEVARFDAKRVHWLDAGDFTLLTAISSTIRQTLKSKYQEPVQSKKRPPSPDKPVVIVDVAHSQYGPRYDFNTLRCVWPATWAPALSSPQPWCFRRGCGPPEASAPAGVARRSA